MTPVDTLNQLRTIAAEWASERRARQARRHLDAKDFQRLAAAGYLRCGLPAAGGGYWQGVAASARPICEMLRAIAAGDSSVALVAAMHPVVLSIWLHVEQADGVFQDAWRRQREVIFSTVRAGDWWGTVTSEPGSGGDLLKTKATARSASEGGYRLTGDKHFASGFGIVSHMITLAVPDADALPDIFILDLAGVPTDGSRGVKIAAEWDGLGMTATQSHAVRFDGFPATRNAWPASVQQVGGLVATFGSCAFAAVIVGIIETAVATARAQLQQKRNTLRPYEQVEWSRVEMEAWLIEQAYEGMLRTIEARDESRAASTGLNGKTAIAELAESAMTRLCRVIGGGSFSRGSPYGNWAADVRALGFLRPPWGLVFDLLFAQSLPA